MAPLRYTYLKLDEFEVWGKECADGSWELRVFAEEDRKIKTYEPATPDRLPNSKRIGELEVIRRALATWSKPEL